MAQIKAAFFDIDGTLLPFGSRRMPNSTLAALGALRDRGVKLFIASGRPPLHMPHLKAALPFRFDGYVLCNGQYCTDADGAPFHRHAIPAETFRTLVPWLEGREIAVSFVEADHAYFNYINARCENIHREMNQQIEDITRSYTHETYQLSVFLDGVDEAEFMAHCPGCRSLRWTDDFADIVPRDGGKAHGLAAALRRYGLTREEAIAFGDGGNDIEMLEYAGIGVAMGNGVDAVKAAADYTTAAVTEGGVAKALHHFLGEDFAAAAAMQD